MSLRILLALLFSLLASVALGADGFIQVPPDSIGKKTDMSEITVGGQTVERQRMAIGDPVNGANLATVTGAGALKVDGSSATQPVSGTLSIGNFPSVQGVNLSQIHGLDVQTGHGTAANTLRVELPTDGTGQVTALQGGAPWSVTGTGTAGSPAAGILTVQGNASGTPIPIVCTGGTCSGGGGGGGTSLADEGTFTQGTTPFTPAGCFFNSSITNLTSGQAGSVQCTLDRMLFVNIGKFGGSAVVTGTGTGGAGIPRVTVSSDSFPTTQAISAASLPIPTGASTAAKQPALGVAGTPSADVLTVQGAASMTALKVDGSAVTQPVSGSVSVSNFPATQPVSGTVTANQGGAPWSVTGSGTFTTSDSHYPASLALSDALANPTTTELGVNNLGWDATNTLWRRMQVDAGTGTLKVDPGTVAVTGTFFQATQPVSGTVSAAQSGTWTVQPGNTANTTAWKVDGSAVTQPVSGTVTTSPPANASSNVAQINGVTPLMGNGVTGTGSQRVTVASDNTAFTVNAAQSGTWTVQPGNTANTTAWKVDGSAVTQPVSGTVTDNQGTANSAANGWPVKVTDGTNVGAVKAASTAAAATDPSTVTQLSPNQPQLTTPLNIQGGKTNNNAAPGATNIGALDILANAAPPTWTEGDQVLGSADLAGNQRVYDHPPNVLGCYAVNTRTPTYAGLAAAAPLFSMRWGDATHIAIIQRVQIFVVTTVSASTTPSLTERELVIARSFTVSDSGGTAIVLTGNNNKMRTSQGTSLVTDMRVGGALTAGTRTLDANPVSSVGGWSPLTTVGVVIGSAGAAAGSGFVDLYNITGGQEYPIVLATNEGIIVRIGKDAEATSATQQTYLNVKWCEASAY